LQEVDMIANNRQGLIFNIDKHFRPFKIEFGYALSQELENDFQGVSYQHMVNAFPRSRFQPWVAGAGPYGRVSSRYRRSLETLTLTDGSRAKKTFLAADLTLKSKIRIAKKDLILMNFLYRGNAGTTFSPMGEKYLETTYEEFSAYYQFFKKVNLLAFYSIQYTKGNTDTELAPNGAPLMQTGQGYGFGIDYDFVKNAGLYLRHRWMSQYDPNFTADRFNGTETTIELKYFF
jgi:hypothetical protein